MADTTSRKVIEYVADTRDVLTKISQIARANEKMAKNLGFDFTKGIKSIDQGLGSLSKKTVFDKQGNAIDKATVGIEKFSKVLKNSDGDLAKYTETTRRVGENIKSTTTSISDIPQKTFIKNTDKVKSVVAGADGAMRNLITTTKTMSNGTKIVSTSFSDMNKNTVSLGTNIARLASRAALTIPLWLALRGAIMGVIRGISDGFKDIVKFDTALQKLRKNLQGTPEEISKNFSFAKKEITDFSISSGKSTEDITKAIQKFATVGFDFATSMQAGIDATKLSVVLFGEAEDTANAFARGLRALITDVNDTAKTQGEISSALAITSGLWETNAFEIGELNNGLEKFAGTAKSMNFTIEETITLLAALSTRGVTADRAGTLLRTTTAKLETNLSKVAKVLGVQVNPQVDRTFDVFVKVTNAIAKLKKESKTVAPEVSNAISELFGGSRSGEPIRAIIADMEGVNESFNKFAKSSASIDKMRTDFEAMNNTVFRQVEIMKNLGKETGKAFVVGITGGDEFLESLKLINSVLLNIQKTAGLTGSTISSFTKAGNFGAITNLIDEISGTDLFGSLIKNNSKPKLLLSMFKGILGNTGDIGQLFADSIITPFEKSSQKSFERVINGLKGKLSKDEVSNLLFDIDKGKINIKNIDVSRLKKGIEDAFNKEPIDVKTNISSVSTQRPEIERQKLAEKLLSNELERLKSIGATNSELLKAELIYTNLLDLSREDEDILNKKLELERAISDEKRLQSRLGSESIKLFRIAQQSGTDVAKNIADVLSGNLDINKFFQDFSFAKSASIFKKEFADVLEQQQAMSFFTGQQLPGKSPFAFDFSSASGRDIPIAESAIRQPFDLQGAVSRGARENILPEKTSQALNNINQTNNINNVFNIVPNNSNEIIEYLEQAFDSPKIKQKLSQMITGNKQTNIL